MYLKENSAKILEVQFEGLANNRRVSANNFCDFLDLEFEESMITGESFDSSVIFKGSHHKGVKENKIDNTSERGKGVELYWMNRISRFENRWARLYNNTPYEAGTHGAQTEPSYRELTFCYCIYFIMKCKIFITTTLYWVLPKRALQLKKRSFTLNLYDKERNR